MHFSNKNYYGKLLEMILSITTGIIAPLALIFMVYFSMESPFIAIVVLSAIIVYLMVRIIGPDIVRFRDVAVRRRLMGELNQRLDEFIEAWSDDGRPTMTYRGNSQLAVMREEDGSFELAVTPFNGRGYGYRVHQFGISQLGEDSGAVITPEEVDALIIGIAIRRDSLLAEQNDALPLREPVSL